MNKKLKRMFDGNTRKVPDHLIRVYEDADRTVFKVKEHGMTYRRPANPRPETLAGPRCVHAFRRGR